MTNSPSVADLLKNVQKLNDADFEYFLSKVMTIKNPPKVKELSIEESDILEEIQTSIPLTKQIRFNYLIAKRDASSIDSSEFKELLALTNEIELADLKRLQLIHQLAVSRNITFSEALEVFNIRPIPHG